MGKEDFGFGGYSPAQSYRVNDYVVYYRAIE